MTFAELQLVDRNAKEILKKLKAKYAADGTATAAPGLDAYLVYSSPLGQAPLGSGAKALLQVFPSMCLDSDSKSKALKCLKERSQYEEGSTEVKDLDTKIDEYCVNIEVDPAVQIELRFGELNYEIVRQLQVDELVDQTRTPQSRSSIRIVLGTLRSLLG